MFPIIKLIKLATTIKVSNLDLLISPVQKSKNKTKKKIKKRITVIEKVNGYLIGYLISNCFLFVSISSIFLSKNKINLFAQILAKLLENLNISTSFSITNISKMSSKRSLRVSKRSLRAGCVAQPRTRCYFYDNTQPPRALTHLCPSSIAVGRPLKPNLSIIRLSAPKHSSPVHVPIRAAVLILLRWAGRAGI